MRTKLAATAFKMPLYSISFPLSAYPVPSTVFRNSEELSCANEVSASKPLFNKGLLLSGRNPSGLQFYKISSIQETMPWCLEGGAVRFQSCEVQQRIIAAVCVF